MFVGQQPSSLTEASFMTKEACLHVIGFFQPSVQFKASLRGGGGIHPFHVLKMDAVND